jgi:hypothetical protein
MGALRMNPAVKERFVVALRSGRYAQVRGAFRARDGLCAMGLLAELSGLVRWEERDPSYFAAQFPAVLAWAGMDSATAVCIARWNDSGVTFREIADRIEGRVLAREARQSPLSRTPAALPRRLRTPPTLPLAA